MEVTTSNGLDRSGFSLEGRWSNDMLMDQFHSHLQHRYAEWSAHNEMVMSLLINSMEPSARVSCFWTRQNEFGIMSHSCIQKARIPEFLGWSSTLLCLSKGIFLLHHTTTMHGWPRGKSWLSINPFQCVHAQWLVDAGYMKNLLLRGKRIQSAA